MENQLDVSFLTVPHEYYYVFNAKTKLGEIPEHSTHYPSIDLNLLNRYINID